MDSVSKVYSDVNEKYGSDWYEYDKLNVSWGSLDQYEIVKRVGKGKYSDVFEGWDTTREQKCIIKVLKPVKKTKIKREIKVLQNLTGGINIVGLLDVVRDPYSKVPSLIMEYIDNDPFKELMPSLTDGDNRFYLLELLKALDFCHSKGIMHRDVKFQNIVVDHKRRKLRLIDWGLAEFYHPGVEYNVRVATRCYKGPELLVDFRQYDYSLDMWSVGCILASLIFRKEPFFYGKDNTDQLVKIARVLGTDELYRYLDKYEIELDAAFDDILPRFNRRPWNALVTAHVQHLATSDALNLLEKLLKYDHQARLTAAEAQQHVYFASVKSKPAAMDPRSSDESGLD